MFLCYHPLCDAQHVAVTVSLWQFQRHGETPAGTRHGENPRFLFGKDTILHRKNIHHFEKNRFFQLIFSFLVKLRYKSPLNS